MKYLKLLVLTILAVAFMPLAQAVPPTYDGAVFDTLQVVADDAALFFGVIVALAVLVTGFFLGRRWLKSVS